jgi:hypothetical protein
VGVFTRRDSKSCSGRRGVSADWAATLPRDKKRIFESIVSRWETAYAMMSIALHDALTFRSRGQLICARQQVSVAAELLGRLARLLVSFCEALSAHGRHISDVPSVQPLKSEYFRGDTAQSAASWNSILHHVLFAERSRFFHKLKILSGTLERLEIEFSDVVTDISDGISTEPSVCWGKLDNLHYDFNTCLREAEIVLKSFVRAVPSELLATVVSDLEKNPPAKPGRLRTRTRAYRVSA